MTAAKCAKRYIARAQPWLYSSTLLFGDVLVAVAIVVCLSLISYFRVSRKLGCHGNVEIEPNFANCTIFKLN